MKATLADVRRWAKLVYGRAAITSEGWIRDETDTGKWWELEVQDEYTVALSVCGHTRQQVRAGAVAALMKMAEFRPRRKP